MAMVMVMVEGEGDGDSLTGSDGGIFNVFNRFFW